MLLLRMPRGNAEFWLTLVALLGLVSMHGVYWLVTYPVNKFWIQEENLNRAGAGFFSVGSKSQGRDESRPVRWTALRDRWEYSHVVRAALSTVSLVALVIAVT